MKIFSYLFALLLFACAGPSLDSSEPLACPATTPRTGDACGQLPSGYQCGPCVCGPMGWACPQTPNCGGPASCPASDPHTGESCGQLPDGYQCGPCVCQGRQWSCVRPPDGGGAATCPAEGPRTGDGCGQFPKGYQCGKCVCADSRSWSCN